MSDARPGMIAGEKLCELTGLTDRRHRQLATEGYFPPPAGGDYQLKPTLIGLFRYFRDQVHKKEDSLAGERKAYTRARRLKIERETAILDGLYIERKEIAPLLRNLAMHQRGELQNKLENELPPKLAGQDPIVIRERMATAVDEICGIFSKATREWVVAAGPEKPEAAGEVLPDGHREGKKA